MTERGWPPLAWMRKQNKRLVMFTRKGENVLPRAVASDSAFLAESYWSIGQLGDKYECTSRNSHALNRKHPNFDYLFVMNHFRDVALAQSAIKDNHIGFLRDRVNKYCQLAAGRLPNFVAVDFYEIGDAKTFVDELNQMWSKIR